MVRTLPLAESWRDGAQAIMLLPSYPKSPKRSLGLMPEWNPLGISLARESHFENDFTNRHLSSTVASPSASSALDLLFMTKYPRKIGLKLCSQNHQFSHVCDGDL